MGEYQFQSPALEAPSVAGVVPRPRVDAAVQGRLPAVLMVGMHLTRTRGGISTLTSGIINSALRDRYEFIYIASQAEELGRLRKVFLAVSSLLRFALKCLFARPELCYIHIGSNASLYRESAFVLVSRLFRRPTVVHFHAGDLNDYYPMQSKIGKRFIRTALAMSHRIIAVSDESAGQLRRLNDSLPISVVPNVIDVSAFLAQQRQAKKAGTSGPVRLLFVGAAGKLKGESDLVMALALLKREGLNIKASFLGYGTEHLAAYFEELGVSECIEHLGPVAMGERYAFYERADIFVLPTYAEAMPISVIEAMASGLPIVTTNVGGIPEIIEDERDGCLVNCGDVTALAERISMLVANPDKRYEMGDHARRRCRQEMDFEKYIQRIDTELKSVTWKMTGL